LADDLFDLTSYGFKRNAQRLEGLGGNAFALVNETEQNVLGADVVVVQQSGFFLGEYYYSPSPKRSNTDPPLVWSGLRDFRNQMILTVVRGVNNECTCALSPLTPRGDRTLLVDRRSTEMSQRTSQRRGHLSNSNVEYWLRGR